MKNISKKLILSKISALLDFALHYYAIAFFVIISCVFGFMVLRINQLANIEPTDQAYSDKLTEVKRPRVDDKVVKVLKNLEDNNIEVQSVFKQARDNPFNE